MNGAHDLGGMQGFGPVEPEANEPVFHAGWEGRVYALNRALRSHGRWNLDAWRWEIEQLPPAGYLRMSYYERWFAINCSLAVKHGLIAAAELASGRPSPGSSRSTPPLTAAMAPGFLFRNVAQTAVPPASLFTVGQSVKARNMHPTGHTRLPRYARGRQGVIARDHGVYEFPDTNSQFAGQKWQHVYAVRFAARELWGPRAAPQDSIYIDLWDDYLEPI